MRIRDALMVCILGFGAPPVFGEPAPCTSTATGDLHFHQLSSKIFGNTRTIRVLLPQGYNAPANSEKRYPVLYLLDGQNLFDACLSEVSHKEWQVDETMYRLAAEKAIPEMIELADEFALRERGIAVAELAGHVKSVRLDQLVEQLGTGAKAIWN